jgi:hypothetical protein
MEAARAALQPSSSHDECDEAQNWNEAGRQTTNGERHPTNGERHRSGFYIECRQLPAGLKPKRPSWWLRGCALDCVEVQHSG